jgi:nitrogen regulatory protein PII
VSLENRKLVTIITEAAIERNLIADLERLGAHGYTVTDARGKGSRGVRDAEWSTSSNIRIEVVCDAETADRISAHLKARYYDNYAMISFVGDVGVLRPEKF